MTTRQLGSGRLFRGNTAALGTGPLNAAAIATVDPLLATSPQQYQSEQLAALYPG